MAVDCGGLRKLVTALSKIDIAIASLPPAAMGEQIPLAEASKKAGVQRLVPPRICPSYAGEGYRRRSRYGTN